MDKGGANESLVIQLLIGLVNTATAKQNVASTYERRQISLGKIRIFRENSKRFASKFLGNRTRNLI